MDGSLRQSSDRSDLFYQRCEQTLISNSYLQSRRKRCVDVIGAVLIGVTFSPVILGVTAIMAFQQGPIIFGHERVGRHGARFRCYKFRSMVPNADEVLKKLLDVDPSAREEWRQDFKLKKDPRVTRLGEFLRKTSLDELPQLWNVLNGTMSLVGPRPVVRDELVRYGRGARFYLSNRPGLTGLWQISGRSDLSYKRRVALDRAYIENAGLLFDLWLVIKTALIVVVRRGAY